MQVHRLHCELVPESPIVNKDKLNTPKNILLNRRIIEGEIEERIKKKIVDRMSKKPKLEYVN